MRYSQNALAQVVKRLSEEFNKGSPLNPGPFLKFYHVPILSRSHSHGPLPDDSIDYDFQQFKAVKYHYCNLTNYHPNCYVYIDDESSSVVAIENLVLDANDGSVYFVGNLSLDETALSLNPCDSFDIFSIKRVTQRSHMLSLFPIKLVKSKASFMTCFD